MLSDNGLPVYISPTEPFASLVAMGIRVGITCAIIAGTGVVSWLIWPVLKPHERTALAVTIPVSATLFVAGFLFSHFVILPNGLRFLLTFADGYATASVRLSEYQALVLMLDTWLGIIFQIPLAMYVLAKLRVVSLARFRKIRKFMPLAAGILGIFISPGVDPINALLVAVPIEVLFEVGLFFAWLAESEKGRRIMWRIGLVVLGVLRRLTVTLLIIVPVLPTAWFLYGVALLVVFFMDGHLSAEMPSRRKAWVDRFYDQVMFELSGKVLLPRRRVWGSARRSIPPRS